MERVREEGPGLRGMGSHRVFIYPEPTEKEKVGIVGYQT